MSKIQANPRHSLVRGAAVATRLNATRTVAPHILQTTVEREAGRGVVHMQVMEPAYCGAIVL